jgi:hypothetical protein
MSLEKWLISKGIDPKKAKEVALLKEKSDKGKLCNDCAGD